VPTTVAALNILVFLLPGFLSDRIIVSLNAPRERSDLVFVIDALVFAFVDYVIYSFAAAHLKLPAIPIQVSANGAEFLPGQSASLALLLAIAAVVGLIWAKISDAGWLYKLLKYLHVTRVTGRVDVWHDIFTDFRGYWFQVRLKDGTRITGWPDYFSDNPAKREVFLREALIESPDGRDYDLEGPGVLLTERAEIERIEILNKETDHVGREKTTD
jgi:hypothetical protein